MCVSAGGVHVCVKQRWVWPPGFLHRLQHHQAISRHVADLRQPCGMKYIHKYMRTFKHTHSHAYTLTLTYIHTHINTQIWSSTECTSMAYELGQPLTFSTPSCFFFTYFYFYSFRFSLNLPVSLSLSIFCRTGRRSTSMRITQRSLRETRMWWKR